MRFCNQLSAKDFKTIGKIYESKTINLELPEGEEIPDYGDISGPGGIVFPRGDPMAVRGYYRNYYEYLSFHLGMKRVDFPVCNESSTVARDVQLLCEIEDPDDLYRFADSYEFLRKPRRSLELHRGISGGALPHDITVQQTGRSWIIKAVLGKIQPRGSAYTKSGLFVGARESAELEPEIRVFADNLPHPSSQRLSIKMQPEQQTVDISSFIEALEEKDINIEEA
jgi:hypothetical protein